MSNKYIEHEARYIDANSAMKKLGVSACELYAKAVLRDAPTADVVEVKHGYWTGVLSADYAHAEGLPLNATNDMRRKYEEHMEHITHCSNCNAMFDDRYIKNWKVCPYCITIMDKNSEMFDAVKAKNDCVQWIRDFFENNGKGCNAVIGISGGKDSTVAAALCVEALGKDRVIGVMMPNGEQSDIDDAFEVCEYLDIAALNVNIENTYKEMLKAVSHSVNYDFCCGGFKLSEQSLINLSPRIRMSTLYLISQSFNGRVVCTDNLSESFIGYSTRWGDNVGDFSPLAGFTSEEVVVIGDVLGLPYELTHKTPSDGLCGKTDEDRFGFTYEVLNKYIRTGICEDEETKKKIDEMHQKNLFKLQPIPSFSYEEGK